MKASPWAETTNDDVIDAMNSTKLDIIQRSNIMFQLGRLKGIAYSLDYRVMKDIPIDKSELAKDLLDIEKKIQAQLDKDYEELKASL